MAGELRNCIRCGRPFVYYGGKPICPECKEELERDFLKVYNYLRDHPRARIKEVAEETGVDEEDILDFIDEGRIETKYVSIEDLQEEEEHPIEKASIDEVVKEIGKAKEEIEKEKQKKEVYRTYMAEVISKKKKNKPQ